MDAPKAPLIIPRPIELAGMRSRLLRAQQQQKDIAVIGKDYDDVMDRIDEAKSVLKGHVSDLSLYDASVRATIESMVDRTNGAPTGGESDGRQMSSDQGAQAVQPKTEAVEGEAATAPAEPEQLTTNGVTVG